MSMNSCTTEPDSFVLIDTNIDFIVKSKEGKDLLDPANSGYSESNIQLFHIVDGIKTEYFDATKTAPKGFLLFDNTSEYRIRIFTQNVSSTNTYESVIQWDSNDEDILAYHVKYENNGTNVMVDKVWINQVEVWNLKSHGDDRTIVIEK